MRVIAVVQARMGSSRLPGKVLRDLAGLPVLQHVTTRASRSRRLTGVVVAAPDTPVDAPMHDFVRGLGVPLVLGDEHDVLSRFVRAAAESRADVLVRITSDCPFIDPATIDRAIDEFVARGDDYVSVEQAGGYPRGLDTEVFSVDALRRADALAEPGPEREHVTLRMYRDAGSFRSSLLTAPDDLRRPDYRLTLDEIRDLELLSAIYAELGAAAPDADVRDAIAMLDARPDIASINAAVEQKTV